MITGNTFEINEKSDFPEVLLKYLLYIKNADFSKMQDGKHVLEEDITLNLSSYQTKNLEEKKAESHKKYIDIQYVISGVETIGVGYENQENELLENYNEEKDCIFYKKIKDENFIIVSAGMFAIFFPTDIHRPGCSFNDKLDVRKVVIKISVNKKNE